MENGSNVKDVFHIVDIEGKKSVWTKIGTAFVNKDSSLNVLLNTLPINGRLHIRDKHNKKGKE